MHQMRMSKGPAIRQKILDTQYNTSAEQRENTCDLKGK